MADEPAPLCACCWMPRSSRWRRRRGIAAAAGTAPRRRRRRANRRRYHRHRRLGPGPARRKEPESQRSRKDASSSFSICMENNGGPETLFPQALNPPSLIEAVELAELAQFRPRRAEIVGLVLPVAVADRHAAEQHLVLAAISGNRRRCRRAAPRPPAGRCRGRSRGRGMPAHGCSRRDRPIGRGRAGGRW